MWSSASLSGFDVAYCSGPGDNPGDCPLVRGQRCHLPAGADAVLHGLHPALGIAAAIRLRHPGITVVAKQRHRADGSVEAVPEGCEALCYECSVKGQIDAMRQALGGRNARV